MNLVLVGLNHRTAPVELRECLAPPPEELPLRMEDLMRVEPVREAIMVATCNRVEVLAAGEEAEDLAGALRGWLAATGAVGAAELEQALYVHAGHEAVRHLFRVASSLDSLVVGEPQILGQIKDAFRAAAKAGASRSVLNRLLHKTFQVAKRVRSETRIGGAAVSVAGAAVDLAQKIFDDLAGRSALLVGAGEMAELAAEHLLGHGVSRVLVANRTLERAVDLAERFGGRAMGLEAVAEVLAEVDIVITSTGSPHPIIDVKLAKKALKKRRGRPLFFIDIAVPRDIDQAVGELDGCFLYDVDDLTEVVQAGRESRAEEARAAERIVDEEVIKFMAWLSGLEAVPTISALTAKAEQIRAAELARTLHDMGLADGPEAEAVDRLTRAVVKKILHDPILFIKGGGRGAGHRSRQVQREHLVMVRRIFNLGEEPED